MPPDEEYVTYTVEAKVKLPMVPNFLITDGGTSMPLSAFTDAALEELAVKWTAALLAKARRQKENRNA